MLVIVSNPQKKSSDEDLDEEKPASPIEEVSETQDLKSEVNLPILTPISPKRSSPIRIVEIESGEDDSEEDTKKLKEKPTSSQAVFGPMMSKLKHLFHPPNIFDAFEQIAEEMKVERTTALQTEDQVSALLTLTLRVRKQEKTRLFYCPWIGCSKNFQKRDGMIRHIRAHVDIRPFECKICNQKFLRSDHLSVHMIRHSNEVSNDSFQSDETSGNKEEGDKNATGDHTNIFITKKRKKKSDET